jgi:hypothetical protein
VSWPYFRSSSPPFCFSFALSPSASSLLGQTCLGLLVSVSSTPLPPRPPSPTLPILPYPYPIKYVCASSEGARWAVSALCLTYHATSWEIFRRVIDSAMGMWEAARRTAFVFVVDSTPPPAPPSLVCGFCYSCCGGFHGSESGRAIRVDLWRAAPPSCSCWDADWVRRAYARIKPGI